MTAYKPPSHPRPPNETRPSGVLQTTIAVAILLATLFTAFSPTMFAAGNFSAKLSQLLARPPEVASTAVPTPGQSIRIGIVSGHWGHDSGAVCDNGTTEQQVNLVIANLVQQKLIALGYQVDLLQEFDPRLEGYKATALLSIHNDSCEYINDEATGFKVASALASTNPGMSDRLVACIRDRYGRTTGLPFHNSITRDMTQYHAFSEIDPSTTAAIIEAGFLYEDYAILTSHPDVVADGIVAGIVCFVNNESVIVPTPTP
ncbi:MAG: N-acetylmuramoyl-L-alanine amidase [Anaerolineales bacterium]